MAPKSKTKYDGLGRAIINRKIKDHQKAHESGRYTADLSSADNLKSVTQERDLEAFLSAATLADTDFTAERRNVTVVAASSNPVQNPHLLSPEEEKKTLRTFDENKNRLRVPRRAPWKKSMNKQILDRQEKDGFLEWRRGLAELQDRDKFLLTPFERNIEVWRQLWRVLERSHLVVQIVDARNPLRFRCEDLERYVLEVEGVEGEQGTGAGLRKNLLLINKADLLTAHQRRLWANFFDARGVQYAFFSALNAAALQEARRNELAAEQMREEQLKAAEANGTDESHDTLDGDSSGSENWVDEVNDSQKQYDDSDDSSDDEERLDYSAEDGDAAAKDPRIRVLSVLELEDLFQQAAPNLETFAGTSGNRPERLVVGLVGYPNVGKSSTINALLGEKKVSVSSTPGKTKHFQTINLSTDIILCDCPGLVFPQFASTQADLVCDGVLPIDQLREHTGPVALVVKRIPRAVLEATYGISMRVRGIEEGGSGQVTPESLLVPYAIARGFMKSGQGNPDESRASRYILKDYVNAKLLFCHPPPGEDADAFNEKTREISLRQVAKKKKAPVTRVGKNADTFVATNAPSATSPTSNVPSAKLNALDREFFASQAGLSSRAFVQGSARNGQEFARGRLYPHQNAVADNGTPLSGRRSRVAAVLASAGADGESGKKHKKTKRTKQRSGKGYDD